MLRLTAQIAEPDASVGALVADLLAEGLDAVHRYSPHGVSWARMAGDVRVTVHTWPEHELATVDVFGVAEARVLEVLRSRGWQVVQLHRSLRR